MAISFKGGKRYKKCNGFSERTTIKTPLPSPFYYYNTSLPNSIALTPCVKEGDYVLKGQKIADLDVYDALPVFSSVSGLISSISENLITVENNMLHEEIESFANNTSVDNLTTREILWLIREGGIREIRTGCPLHVLLSQKKVPDCVIICCFDSDPYVSAPQTAALGNAEKILNALNVTMRLFGTKKAYIAVEQGCGSIYSDFKYHLRYNKDILLYSLKARYPQSRSDILIKTVTGKSANDINAVILSPETLCGVSDVLKYGKPVTDKLVTVSGDDILPPVVYRAPLGMPISALIANSGYTNPQILIKNGIISGDEISDFDMPIDSDTEAISVFNDKKYIPKYAKELI